MSSTAEMLVAADTILTIATGPLGLAANLVGTGAYAAYSVVRQLQQDYQTTLDELHAQCAADQQARDHAARAQQAGETTALLLAGLTASHAAEDAEITFLRAQVSQLAESAPADTPFVIQCHTLLRAMAESPEQIPLHLTNYQRLRDAYAPDTAKLHTGRFTQELSQLREEILSPLLDASACTDLRAQLLAQLDQLQQLAVRQQVLARQGLQLLRQRVQREQYAQVEQRTTRQQQAETQRALVTNCLARLRSVSNLPDAPEHTARAKVLLGRLADAFAGNSADIPATVHTLSQEADALYAACERYLKERLVSAYVGDQVSEVLVTLGYQVSHVETNTGTTQRELLTAVDADFGIEFQIQGNGRLTTEMVALSEDGARAGAAAQEKVCSLVDQVIGELRTRKLPIRERLRSSLTPNQQLRVVETPEEEEIAGQHTAPRLREMENP